MLVLYNSCEFGLFVSIVHNGYTLIVFTVKQFVFKTEAAVFELAEAIVVILVYGARVDNGVRKGGKSFPVL